MNNSRTASLVTIQLHHTASLRLPVVNFTYVTSWNGNRVLDFIEVYFKNHIPIWYNCDMKTWRLSGAHAVASVRFHAHKDEVQDE